MLEYTVSFQRARRATLFRTWDSLWAMLPKVLACASTHIQMRLYGFMYVCMYARMCAPCISRLPSTDSAHTPSFLSDRVEILCAVLGGLTSHLSCYPGWRCCARWPNIPLIYPVPQGGAAVLGDGRWAAENSYLKKHYETESQSFAHMIQFFQSQQVWVVPRGKCT